MSDRHHNNANSKKGGHELSYTSAALKRRPQIGQESHLDDSYTDIHHEDHEDVENSEPLVELLEKERSEWHEERVKLLNCIQLQQIELMQRSISSQDRAGEIAKEFARSIESFDMRLESMESSMVKEVEQVRSIVSDLKNVLEGLHSEITKIKSK